MKRTITAILATAALFGLTSSSAFANWTGGGAKTQVTASHDHLTDHPVGHLLSQLWTCDPDQDGVVTATWVNTAHNLVAKLKTDDDGEGFDEVNAGVFIEGQLPVDTRNINTIGYEVKFIGTSSGEDPDCYHGPFLIVTGRNVGGGTYAEFLGPDGGTVIGPDADGFFHVTFHNMSSATINRLGVATTHHTDAILIRNVRIGGTVAVADTHHHATNCEFGTDFCNDFDVFGYCGPGGCAK